jgi:small subunit ribosomal protein S9
MVTKKTPTTKAAKDKTVKPAAKDMVKKPRVAAKKVEQAPATVEAVVPTVETTEMADLKLQFGKPTISGGRYVFATGRRKTAIANIRLFSGQGKSTINKKALDQYFGHTIYREELMKPLELTGLANDFYFTAHVNGGGIHAQSQAVRHGLAQALASFNDEIKKVLKKNTFLTRDDRKKERKKPGLKRARRSPQWAKR